MTTWVEARAAKAERLRRQTVYYTPDKAGKVCTDCGRRMDKVLSDLGYNTHPTCGAESRRVMAAAPS